MKDFIDIKIFKLYRLEFWFDKDKILIFSLVISFTNKNTIGRTPGFAIGILGFTFRILKIIK